MASLDLFADAGEATAAKALGVALAIARRGIAWLGTAWLGIAWLGTAWLGIAWLGRDLASRERQLARSALSLCEVIAVVGCGIRVAHQLCQRVHLSAIMVHATLVGRGGRRAGAHAVQHKEPAGTGTGVPMVPHGDRDSLAFCRARRTVNPICV